MTAGVSIIRAVTSSSAYSTENRVWVDYADIPKDMEHAAVAIEDKRFYKHKGVDWYMSKWNFQVIFLFHA